MIFIIESYFINNTYQDKRKALRKEGKKDKREIGKRGEREEGRGGKRDGKGISERILGPREQL